MTRLRSLIGLGTAGLLAACYGSLTAQDLEVPEYPDAEAPDMQSAPEQPPAAVELALAGPSIDHVSYRSTACLGTCPMYQVTLHASGQIDWVGERFVEVVGRARAHVGSETVARLFERLAAIDLDAIPTEYGRGADCKELWTDHPSVVLTVGRGGKEQTITDYHGCYGNAALEALRPLEDTFEALVDVDRFVGRFPSCTAYGSSNLWLPPRADGKPPLYDARPVLDLMARDPSSRVRVRAHASRRDVAGASQGRAEQFVEQFVEQGGDRVRIEIIDLGTTFATRAPDDERVHFDEALELEVVSDECLGGTREHFGGPRLPK